MRAVTAAGGALLAITACLAALAGAAILGDRLARWSGRRDRRDEEAERQAVREALRRYYGDPEDPGDLARRYFPGRLR